MGHSHAMRYERRQSKKRRCPKCGGILPHGCTCNTKPTEESMIVLELTDSRKTKFHFIGTSKDAIMEDARLFGDLTLVRILSVQEARAENMQYLDDGIEAMRRGIQKSFKVLSS